MGRIEIGHKKNPLILEPEKLDRPLINKYISKVGFKFSNKKVDGHNYYLLNLSGNQFISKSALRIGVFLYDYFIAPEFTVNGFESNDGEIFYISNQETNDRNHTKEGTFYCLYRGQEYYFPRPVKDLIEILRGFGIVITSSNLIKALNELHDFHYITLSPRPRREVGNKVKYYRTCFRHIRLYKGMMQKPFYPALKSKEKKERKSTNKVSSDS